MVKFWIVPILLLTSCVTSDDTRALNACVASGKTRDECACATSKDAELMAQGVVGEDIVRSVQLYTEGKSEEAERLLNTLPYERRYSEMSLLGNARDVCWR